MVIGVTNPKTGRPISPVTLRKHFRLELDRGLLMADVKAGENLLRLTGTSAAAAIFWAKVRLHMKETSEFSVPLVGDGEFSPTGPEDIKDTARRIAFTLTLAGRQVKPPKPKTALDK